MHKGAVATNGFQLRGRVGRALQSIGLVVALGGWVLALLQGKENNAVAMTVFTIGWGTAALSWAFLGAFEKLALARLIQDLPTAKIRSAPQGYVELHGRVRRSDEYIECPACGQRCLWFQYYSGGKHRKRFVPSGRTPDIVLDDDTGRCVVKAHGAELFSGHENEHVHIGSGDPLYVLGEFRTIPATTPAAPSAGRVRFTLQPEDAKVRDRAEAVRRKLQQIRYDARHLGVFDVNRDGKVDARELEAARRVVERQVDREPVAPGVARPEHVIRQPATDRDRLPFVIFVGEEDDAVAAARVEARRRAVLAVVASLFVVTFLLVSSQMAAQSSDKRRAASTQQARTAAAKPVAAKPAARTPRQQAFDLHRAGRLEDAITAYDALIDQSPDDAELHFWRGAAHGRLGNEAVALESMSRSCELGNAEACEIRRRRPQPR